MTETVLERLNAALRGRYRIERELGEGGMATVYLADDLRHERKVALKVLRPELAAVVGAERFLAEIKTTANLQHPNILPLFDSGEADGFLYYVMPFIDGETLADRIARERQLPVEDAMKIASDVAEALLAAHEQGVIHRDIKPANILLSRGRPLVSDFGIALAVGAAGGRLTETGLSVGTPHYMSPEQVTGDHEIGPWTDVYALACVLHEMLVGEPPHSGRSAQAVITKIIAGEPVSPSKKRPTVPIHVDAVVRRALERLPADRFAGAADFAGALANPGFRHRSAAGAEPASARKRGVGMALAASGWVAAFLAVLVLSQRGVETGPRPVVRTEVFRTPEHEWVGAGGIGITISPDGDAIAYIGREQILYRRLDELESRPLRGASRGRMPVMSPDGSSIAFVYPMGFGGGLLTLPVQGGPPTVVVAEGVRDGGGGLAWDSDGWLYYAAQDGAVMRVSASGGTPEALARPEPGVAYQWFGALPNTRGLLVTIGSGAAADSQIGILDIETGEVRPLMPGTTARYSPTGHLVYASSDSSLAAVAFDVETLDLVLGAEPIPLPDRVDVNAGSASQFAIAENGTLVYATGTRCCPNRPVRVDRTGNAIPVDPDWSINASADFSSLSLSPTGDRLAFNTLSDGSVSVWVKPVDGGPVERITFGATSMAEYRASWAPDAESIVFVADWRGHGDLWTTRTDGLGEPKLLLDAEAPIHQGSYSSDGQWMVYQSGQARESDIFAARVGAEEDPIPIQATEFLEHEPALSPDSRWLAYVSDASGQDEVYVVSFPDPTSSGRVSVSSGGGTEPAWGRDGHELFYRSGDDRLVSVTYDGEEDFSITGRQELFSLEGFVEGLGRTLIEPGDGQTFYMLQPIPSPSPTRIILVQNLLGLLGSR